MIDAIRRLFAPKVDAKPVFEISEKEMQAVIPINRQSLSHVSNWIDEYAFKNSCFKYGVPDFIKDDINKPINNDLTYTDLMLHLINKHFAQLNYLEIGVSVGKNFYQLLQGVKSGKFTGFDIEEINPVLEKQLKLVDRSEWQTPAKSIKKTASSYKTYIADGKTVNYLCADVWDENSWAKLKGQKFNLVFSDALHTPQAILFEFEMLVKYDLLADKFIIFWDDLVGKMKYSFYKIIRKYDKEYQIKDIYLLSINGWIGEHEGPHSVGVISNFNL